MQTLWCEAHMGFDPDGMWDQLHVAHCQKLLHWVKGNRIIDVNMQNFC